jgi:hypothetical protein
MPGNGLQGAVTTGRAGRPLPPASGVREEAPGVRR